MGKKRSSQDFELSAARWLLLRASEPVSQDYKNKAQE
jgi:hypothetical protein